MASGFASAFFPSPHWRMAQLMFPVLPFDPADVTRSRAARSRMDAEVSEVFISSAVTRGDATLPWNPLLDTSPENYHKWGIQKASLTPENLGNKMHLRVELQSFFRLPCSNALVFPIRCYLIKLEELVTIPKWGRRFHRVIRDLPEKLANYKGFINNRPMIVDYLKDYDDGSETSAGVWPD